MSQIEALSGRVVFQNFKKKFPSYEYITPIQFRTVICSSKKLLGKTDWNERTKVQSSRLQPLQLFKQIYIFCCNNKKCKWEVNKKLAYRFSHVNKREAGAVEEICRQPTHFFVTRFRGLPSWTDGAWFHVRLTVKSSVEPETGIETPRASIVDHYIELYNGVH